MVGTYKAQCGKGFLWVSWRGKCLRKIWTGGRSFRRISSRHTKLINWDGFLFLYLYQVKAGRSCHPVRLMQRFLWETQTKPREHSSLEEKDISQLFVQIEGSYPYVLWKESLFVELAAKLLCPRNYMICWPYYCEQFLTHLYVIIITPMPFTVTVWWCISGRSHICLRDQDHVEEDNLCRMLHANAIMMIMTNSVIIDDQKYGNNGEDTLAHPRPSHLDRGFPGRVSRRRNTKTLQTPPWCRASKTGPKKA